MLVEQGFAALTHRAVAARAEVPLASASYYFASVDDLAEQALRQATTRWLTASESAFACLPARLVSAPATARALIAVVTGGSGDRSSLSAMYERYLEAGRQPRLRPLVVAANAEVVELVAGVLQRAARRTRAARLVLASIDGLLLAALAEGELEPVASVVPELSRLVALLPRT